MDKRSSNQSQYLISHGSSRQLSYDGGQQGACVGNEGRWERWGLFV